MVQWNTCIFHNGSNYDYYFIINELANESDGQFQCLGENRENYKTFSIPIEKKVTNVDKCGNYSVVTISYKIKLIDLERIMANLLSSLLYNLTEGIPKTKSKDCFIEYENVKDNLIKHKCLSSDKDHSNKKIDSRTYSVFLIIISMKLFCCKEKVLILISTLMNGKSLMKKRSLKKNNFLPT